jgi:hypothetical protein
MKGMVMLVVPSPLAHRLVEAVRRLRTLTVRRGRAARDVFGRHNDESNIRALADRLGVTIAEARLIYSDARRHGFGWAMRNHEARRGSSTTGTRAGGRSSEEREANTRDG